VLKLVTCGWSGGGVGMSEKVGNKDLIYRTEWPRGRSGQVFCISRSGKSALTT
jgi:hypothetical protein